MDKKFPKQIPVFPLSGVIYFPKTNLPLNIFEERYLDLVNDVIQKDKLMGMIQPRKKDKDVYKIGCLGKISDFQKSSDGRILINLTGITRFEILEEKENKKLYREFKVEYKKFNFGSDDLSLLILFGLRGNSLTPYFNAYPFDIASLILHQPLYLGKPSKTVISSLYEEGIKCLLH